MNVVDAELFTNSHVNDVVTSTLEIIKINKKRMEQHLQDVAQKVINGKNSDSFADHFSKHFTQKPSPQQCRKIMSLEIISTVNPIGSMKTWGKSSCTLCMKQRIEITDNSKRRYSQLINACS